jgi:hypothetical protein
MATKKSTAPAPKAKAKPVLLTAEMAREMADKKYSETADKEVKKILSSIESNVMDYEIGHVLTKEEAPHVAARLRELGYKVTTIVSEDNQPSSLEYNSRCWDEEFERLLHVEWRPLLEQEA